MSLKRIIKTLEGFGFNRIDAKVYIYLAKKGPQKGEDIAKALEISEQQLYSTLKSLQGKGIVTKNARYRNVFSAFGIEKVLDHYIKSNIEQAKELEKSKGDLLAYWDSMTKRKNS